MVLCLDDGGQKVGIWKVMKARMSVSAAEEERMGWRCAMLRRWKKAVLVMLLTGDVKERVGFIIMPRFPGGRGDCVSADEECKFWEEQEGFGADDYDFRFITA